MQHFVERHDERRVAKRAKDEADEIRRLKESLVLPQDMNILRKSLFGMSEVRISPIALRAALLTPLRVECRCDRHRRIVGCGESSVCSLETRK